MDVKLVCALIGGVVIAWFLWPSSEPVPNSARSLEGAPIEAPDRASQDARRIIIAPSPTAVPKSIPKTKPANVQMIRTEPAALGSTTASPVRVPPGHIARAYTVDADGIAVVDGDIAIGLPPDGSVEGNQGVAAVPVIQMWPTRIVPYHIQAELTNSSRVNEALQMFSNTAIRFVPYANEADAVVFEEAEGTCKSYVGRVGGKQPIWISPKCGPHEIAHELMHAIGFIHEQNRTDRDQFVKLMPEAIDDKFKINFDKMPDTFMRISGLSEFSYDSIMIYPPTMFSRNAQATMVPVQEGKRIQPSEGLNERDRERINAYYGQR